MADIKVCDRCGKTLTSKRACLKKYRSYAFEFFSKGGCYVEFADLCEECTKDFEKWLKGEKVTE